MKKIIFACLLVGLASMLFGLTKEQYAISEILGNDFVKINIGKREKVKVGDIYQVVIGSVTQKEEVEVAKIKVTKVFPKESEAKVMEKKDFFFIGDKIVKVVPAKLEELVPFEEMEKKKEAKKVKKPKQKKKSKKSVNNKKMWVDGPFILGHNDFLIGLKQHGDLLIGTGENFKDTPKYENNYIYLAPTLQYGLWNLFQVGVEVPLVYRKFEGSYSRGTTNYDMEGSGMGVSDIKVNLLFSSSLNKSNTIRFSLGSLLSIPTDDGIMKLTNVDSDGNEEYELNNSMGYMVVSLLGGVGLQTKKSYTFVEYVFDINGKRKGCEYNYNGTEYIVAEYEPDYSSDVKLVSSYFINDKNELKLKLLLEFNENLADKDGRDDKITTFSIFPSYAFTWSKMMFEIGLDYSFSYPESVGAFGSISF